MGGSVRRELIYDAQELARGHGGQRLTFLGDRLVVGRHNRDGAPGTAAGAGPVGDQQASRTWSAPTCTSRGALLPDARVCQDAADVMQQVLVRAWRYLNSFGHRSSVQNWLYRIATSRCPDLPGPGSRCAGLGCRARSPRPNAPDVEVAGLAALPDAALAAVGHDPQAAMTWTSMTWRSCPRSSCCRHVSGRCCCCVICWRFPRPRRARPVDTTVAG